MENNITTGINIDEDTKRYYPYGDLAAQIIGFCGSDNQGLDGIEAKYDDILKGKNGNTEFARIYAAINRGHIFEAYENYLQDLSRPTDERYAINTDKAYEYIANSLGNDPWYSQGDVGSTQVKTFFDRKDRQIASLYSIIDLATSLHDILTKGIDEFVKQGPKRLQTYVEKKMKEQKDVIDQKGNLVIDKEIENSRIELEKSIKI